MDSEEGQEGFDGHILHFDSRSYLDLDSAETAEDLLDSAAYFADRLNKIRSLMNQAESEYRAIVANKEREKLNGGTSEFYEEDNDLARKSLKKLEELLREEIKKIEEKSMMEMSRENDSLSALHEAIITYTGVHTLTIRTNSYAQYSDEIEFDSIPHLRAFSEGNLARNPAAQPLEGLVTEFGETEEDRVNIVLDEDARYGALKRMLEGESLVDVLDDTEAADEEKEKARIEHEADEIDIPILGRGETEHFVWQRNRIDEDFDTSHWERDRPRYIQ